MQALTWLRQGGRLRQGRRCCHTALVLQLRQQERSRVQVEESVPDVALPHDPHQLHTPGCIKRSASTRQGPVQAVSAALGPAASGDCQWPGERRRAAAFALAELTSRLVCQALEAPLRSCSSPSPQPEVAHVGAPQCVGQLEGDAAVADEHHPPGLVQARSELCDGVCIAQGDHMRALADSLQAPCLGHGQSLGLLEADCVSLTAPWAWPRSTGTACRRAGWSRR